MVQNEIFTRIVNEISKAIIGKQESIETLVCAILAGSHVMIEDIPGVGKTMLATAVSTVMGLEHRRVQFTPDILPSDITGFTMYDSNQQKFIYQPGAVMCNLFLADEINRTSPKTQSALLEVMEENSVTIDGQTKPVPRPFVVIATENPLGYAGTQMLPESQLDRFGVCIVMGYPTVNDEIEILKTYAESKYRPLKPVIIREQLLTMQESVRKVYVSDAVYRYIVQLCAATRTHPGVELGISPRGSLALAAIARARAYASGRDYVIPADVSSSFIDTAVHRMVLSSEAKMNHWTARDILTQVLSKTEAPVPERMKSRG